VSGTDFVQVNYSLGDREADVPEFASEFGATTWVQFFLKFILSNPAVTAVIPGTDKLEYMLDNLQAGRGPLPDPALRKRMVQFWDSLA